MVHDALLISIPIPECVERLKEAKKIMVNASIKVVGGPIRVDYQTISTNFVQDKKSQKRFDDIMGEIEQYIFDEKKKATTELTPTNYQTDSTALYD